MNKKITIILAIVSLIIIVFGIIAGLNIKYDSTNNRSSSERIYIDESDVTEITNALWSVGTVFIGAYIIFLTVLLVVAMWLLYGIILLLIFIIKKIKKKTGK